MTPLKAEVWQDEMAEFLDKPFAELIVQGIKQGFRIGYNHALAPLKA